MSFPTVVNDQVTDSVSQVNMNVLGLSPAVAMANLYMSTSLALANAALNATSHQQHNNLTAQATTAISVANLYSIDTADDTASTNQLYNPKPAGL